MKKVAIILAVRNQRGQMAIFIALIFQVLFVLFAMAINVALVVHDKINLQNAVDLAAYYAAERQAEMLNVIAHQNYMIRQSWKLLAFRYRVIGSGGLQSPQHPVYSGSLTDAPFQIAPGVVDPTVCVVHAQNWLNVSSTENLCKNPNVNIPALPQVQVIAGFLPFNFIFAQLANRLRQNMASSCDNYGAFNWWFAAASLQAFRMDQHNRKTVIYALANNLNSRNNGDFIDLDGNSVESGAYKTFSKNLTFTNNQSQVNFKMMNSLQGLRREQWLSEINIAPTMLYMDPQPGAACAGTGQLVQFLPQRGPAQNFLRTPLSAGGMGADDLISWVTNGSGFLTGSEYNYSMGVEKNPWAMAYVGVQAETAPRQIFFPFGSAIRITARAFAKPFGGRIGPWYGSRWPRGADRSVGTETDIVGPPRLGPGGTLTAPNDARRLPNYSRYPGDTMGLRSQLALNGVSGYRNQLSEYSFFQHIWLPMDNTGYNDPMALDTFGGSVPGVRRVEIAAISPDLFDMAYYSIEPNFAVNYLNKLIANRTRIGIPDNVILRGDLGWSRRLNNLTFSVQTQMEVAAGIADPPSLQRPEAYYFARNKMNLLTSWSSGELAFDYSFPFDRFGQCQFNDDAVQPIYKVPGSCMARGGRTGYSVKLLSRDVLTSSANPIGGTGEAPGQIINPPPAGAGW